MKQHFLGVVRNCWWLAVSFLHLFDGTLKNVSGTNYDLDWTEGAHVNIGLDYIINKGIAFTTDVRGLLVLEGDMRNAGAKVGKFDPVSFIGTVGIRLFLPEHLSFRIRRGLLKGTGRFGPEQVTGVVWKSTSGW